MRGMLKPAKANVGRLERAKTKILERIAKSSASDASSGLESEGAEETKEYWR